jgi:nucleoid-associated protein YgaU
MLLAYSAGARKVDLKAARAAISEYENLLAGSRVFNRAQPRPGRRWPSLGIAAAATAGLACAIVAIVAGSGNRTTDASANFAGDMAVHPRTPALTKVFTPANRDVAQSKLPAGASPASLKPAPRDAVRTVKPVTDSGQAPAASNNAPGPAANLAPADIPVAPQVGTGPQRHEIRVRHGDTLQLIAIRYLGSQDRLKSLMDANPQLRNFNLIHPGQIVYLPATSALADSASEE